MGEPGFRLGGSLWSFYSGQDPGTWPSLPEAVQAILEMDLGLGVEVWATKSLDDSEPDSRELSELATVCQGAAFVTVHVRGVYWNWDPANLRCEVDFAQRVGGRVLVLHPACLGLMDPDDRMDAPEIGRLADYAATRGVRLAIENVQDSMWALDRVVEEMGDDPEKTNLGVCIDVGHAHLSRDAGREPVRAYLKRYTGQLVHLHLHDNFGSRDEHLVPGEGTLDWPRLSDELTGIGFSETAVLEVCGPRIVPRSAIREGISRLRRGWSS